SRWMFSTVASRSASSAVSSRPAALRRGPSWKPTSWTPSGLRVLATRLRACRPGRWVVSRRSRPACTSTRFSPTSGTRSATVPRATRSSRDLRW
ncbi:MAG: hypothetical protein ACK559_24810, partial [bacterium]